VVMRTSERVGPMGRVQVDTVVVCLTTGLGWKGDLERRKSGPSRIEYYKKIYGSKTGGVREVAALGVACCEKRFEC
jgi:hypothetical protein